MYKKSVPVLMYHHVRPEAGMIACTPENFEDQLRWLQGYFDDDYIAIAHDLGFEYLYTTLAFGRNTTTTPASRIYRFAVRNRPGKTLGKRIRSSHHPLIGPVFNTTKRWIRDLKRRL